MGRVLTIELTSEQRSELQHNYRTGSSHAFRQRCRMILLKAEGQKTKQICELVGIQSQNQVNSWIKRYRDGYAQQGVGVLHNAPGQGRKPVFDAVADADRVGEAVSNERQKLSDAKAMLEEQLGRPFHIKTLHNFLKTLPGRRSAADTSG